MQFKKFLTLDPLMKTSQFFQFFCDFIFFETNSIRTASKLIMNVVPGEMLTLSNGADVPVVFPIACNLLVNPNNRMKNKPMKCIYGQQMYNTVVHVVWPILHVVQRHRLTRTILSME